MSSNHVLAIVVPLIAGALVALGVFLAAGIYLFRRVGEKTREEASRKGIKVKMFCEDCRSTFEMPASVILSRKFSHAPRKQLSVKKNFVSTKGVPAAGAVEKAVKSKHYYECPICHLKAWLRIADPKAYYKQVMPIYARNQMSMFLMVPIGIGCLVVFGVIYKLVSLFF